MNKACCRQYSKLENLSPSVDGLQIAGKDVLEKIKESMMIDALMGIFIIIIIVKAFVLIVLG